MVLEAIQSQIDLLLQAETLLKQIDRIPEEQIVIKNITDQINQLTQRIEKYRNLRSQAYEDMLEEIITEEEFKDIKKRFSSKLHDAEETKETLLERKHRLIKNTSHLKPWLEQFRKHQNIEKLERNIVVNLIDRIIIYGKDKVSIVFHYQDEMKEMLSLAGISAEEREGAAL